MENELRRRPRRTTLRNEDWGGARGGNSPSRSPTARIQELETTINSTADYAPRQLRIALKTEQARRLLMERSGRAGERF